MPVTSRKNKILSRIASQYAIQDKASSPATTTLSANAAAGASSFSVTSATGLAIGKTIRVGVGEYAELVYIQNLVSTTVTPGRNLRYAHDSGEAVVEQTVYDMGPVAGVPTFEINGEVTEVSVENSRLLYALLNGFVDLSMSTALVGVTPYTFAFGLGIPIAKVTGVGTAADPKTLQSNGSEIGTCVNQFVVLAGFLTDGTPAIMELWGGETDYTGFQVQLGRGIASTVPAKWMGPRGIIQENAVAYVGDVTALPGKADLFDAIDEIEIFETQGTSPLSTTSSASAAAGQKNITLTSTTNLQAGDWLKINTGDLVEYHQVQTVASPVVLKTPLYRTQASGTAVVRQKLTSIGGIQKGSVRFSVGGSVEKIQIEQSRTTIGVKAGDAAAAFDFAIVNADLATIARMAGIAQSLVSGGFLPVDGAGIGLTPMDGVILRGKNQAQRTVLLVMAGCSQGITNLVLSLAKSGVNGLPASLRPGSLFTLMVHD